MTGRAPTGGRGAGGWKIRILRAIAGQGGSAAAGCAPRRGPGSGGGRRAVVLVLVLWIVTVLAVIASSLAFDVQVSSRLAQADRNRFQAYHLARAALSVGFTHLQNDLVMDTQDDPGKIFDSFADVWAEPDRRDRDRPKELGRGTYELEVEDEEGKIPLNSALFVTYKALVEYYGFEPPDSDDLAQAMLDWRDPDDVAGATGEKENMRYSTLAGQDIPRSSRDQVEFSVVLPNEPYLTPDQLVDVLGFMGAGPEVYFGEDPDAEAGRNMRQRDALALGKAVRAERAPRRQPGAGGGGRGRGREKPKAMKDVVTCFSVANRVNVNTASVEALAILLYAAGGCGDLPGAQSSAEAIAKHRKDKADGRGGGGGGGPDDDDAFKNAGDLLKVGGIDQGLVSKLTANSGSLGISLGFKSDTFRVKGTGRVGRAERTLGAVVRRSMDAYNPEDARLLDLRKARGLPTRAKPRRRETGGGKGPRDNLVRIPALRVLQWIE